MSAKVVYLKPSELLFEEGDQSQNLYFLKTGVIRIFRRKDEGNIEIETVRNGQILGELAFFDGQARSASAEALTTCELIEISRTALDETLSKFPDWLNSLTKTISKRLRAANNRIRALESLNTEFKEDHSGNRNREYIYLSADELLSFSVALLAVAVRYGQEVTAKGFEFSHETFEKFSVQILHLNRSKFMSLIELFRVVDLLTDNLILRDTLFLDQFIHFMNQRNLTESKKRQTLSDNGFAVLRLMFQNRNKAVPNIAHAALSDLNIAPLLVGTKIQISHLSELMDQGFVKNILMNSATEITLTFDGNKDVFLFRAFWVVSELDKINLQKRRS